MFRTQSWRDVSPGEVGIEEFYDLWEYVTDRHDTIVLCMSIVDTIVDDVPGGPRCECEDAHSRDQWL